MYWPVPGIQGKKNPMLCQLCKQNKEDISFDNNSITGNLIYYFTQSQY